MRSAPRIHEDRCGPVMIVTYVQSQANSVCLCEIKEVVMVDGQV